MRKIQAIEILREAIRQARINRDQGDQAAHDRVLKLNELLNRIRFANKETVQKLCEAYGIQG